MVFHEHSDFELAKSEAGVHLIDALDRSAKMFIEDISDARTREFDTIPFATLETVGDFGMIFRAHQREVTSIFTHVPDGLEWIGRFVFGIVDNIPSRDPSWTPIFSIDVSQDGEIRYGTDGDWRVGLSSTSHRQARLVDRLKKNLLLAVRNHIQASYTQSRPASV